MWRYLCTILQMLIFGVLNGALPAEARADPAAAYSSSAYYVSQPYNATVSFFFTADPQFGWGSSYSGNEERYTNGYFPSILHRKK